MNLDDQLDELFKDINNEQFRKGRNDREQGLSPCSENKHYLEGYGVQYDYEAKTDRRTSTI